MAAQDTNRMSHTAGDYAMLQQSDQGPPVRPACENKHIPFNKVPPEILSHILIFTWLSYVGADSQDRFRFPSILCKVNHYFHRIVFSTPILWSYLRVTSVTDMPHIHERIHVLSGRLPLDLYIIFKNVAYLDASSLVEKTLIQGASRCRDVTLFYPIPSITQHPCNTFWDHLRLFTEPVQLQAVRLTIDANGASQLNFFPRVATSVRSLDLAGCYLDWRCVALPSTLENLVICEPQGTGFRVSDIARCLSGHSLRFLSINTIVLDPEHQRKGACILGSLEHLELYTLYSWEAADLLGVICAPALRHLSLKDVSKYARSYLPEVNWGPLSFPLLRRLTLWAPAGNAEVLGELLLSLPNSVEDLEIRGDNVVWELQNPELVDFCNRLRHVTAQAVMMRNLEPVLNRRVTPLQTLKIDLEDERITGDDQIAAYRDGLQSFAEEFMIVKNDRILFQSTQ